MELNISAVCFVFVKFGFQLYYVPIFVKIPFQPKSCPHAFKMRTGNMCFNIFHTQGPISSKCKIIQ